MSVSEILRVTRAKMQGIWGFAIAVSAVVAVIAMSIPQLITPVLGTMEFWADILWNILIASPVAMGAMWLFLDIYDDFEVEISHIFLAFKDYGRVVGAVFWKYFLIVMWTLLFIIPGIIAWLNYSQMELLMKDNPMMTGQIAVKESKEMMNGHKGRYFGLYLRIFWPAIIGSMTGIFMMGNAIDINVVTGLFEFDALLAQRASYVSFFSGVAWQLLNAYGRPAFAVFYRDLKSRKEEELSYYNY